MENETSWAVATPWEQHEQVHHATVSHDHSPATRT